VAGGYRRRRQWASKRHYDREAMRERKEAWTEAYRRTPHGKPVELNVCPGEQKQW